MATRQEQAQLRREQFIDTALRVFAAKGVDGTSIKDIAGAASVTPGLLYHYFTSKEALVAAVLSERGFTPKLHALLNGRTELPATIVLPELVRAFDEMLAANADLVSMFFSMSHANTSASGGMQEFVARGQTLLESYLRSRAEAGEIDPALVGVAARTVFAAIAIGHRTGQRVEPDDLVQLILNGLIRG